MNDDAPRGGTLEYGFHGDPSCVVVGTLVRRECCRRRVGLRRETRWVLGEARKSVVIHGIPGDWHQEEWYQGDIDMVQLWWPDWKSTLK